MSTCWTVEVQDGDRWVTQTTTHRFVDAWRAYDDTDSPKRLLRNGNTLPILARHQQLDLFQEGA